MPSPKEIIPVFEMSTDERVRVFRRTFHLRADGSGVQPVLHVSGGGDGVAVFAAFAGVSSTAGSDMFLSGAVPDWARERRGDRVWRVLVLSQVGLPVSQ